MNKLKNVNDLLSRDSRITLNDGTTAPRLGFGSYKSTGEEVASSVSWALEAGYRHIDTAAFYLNEKEVGAAIKGSPLAREEIFLVSKMWPTCYDDPKKALEYSLKQLNADYLDLYLLHWPGTDRDARFRAWETVLNYRERGLIHSAGVSNFLIHHLEDLIREFGATPVVNQIELHPMNQQKELKAWCEAQNIAVTAWAPLMRGRLTEIPELSEMAKKYEKSLPQITLRWHLQKGNIIIPKSVHKERIFQNADLFDFALSDEDMAFIDLLDKQEGTAKDPNTWDGGDFQLPV